MASEKSQPVRVLVIVAERHFLNEDGTEGAYPGYWCAGRFWANGETEVTLEDDPDGDPLTVYNFETGKTEAMPRPGLKVAQKLAQLEHARGGQLLVGHYEADPDKPDGVRQKKSPAMLAYRILGPTQPQAQVAGKK